MAIEVLDLCPVALWAVSWAQQEQTCTVQYRYLLPLINLPLYPLHILTCSKGRSRKILARG